MTPVHLTTYALRNAKVGKEVYYKGETYEITAIGTKYVHLKSVEGSVKKVSKEEISAYTAGLADAHKAFVSTMTEHNREVRAKRYLSRYFMQPKRYAFEG